MLCLRQDNAQHARQAHHLDIPLKPGGAHPVDTHVDGPRRLEPRSYCLTSQVFVCALDRVLQIENDGIRSGLPGLLEAVWPIASHEEIGATDHVLLLKVISCRHNC
jgi:hypothetical protein